MHIARTWNDKDPILLWRELVILSVLNFFKKITHRSRIRRPRFLQRNRLFRTQSIAFTDDICSRSIAYKIKRRNESQSFACMTSCNYAGQMSGLSFTMEVLLPEPKNTPNRQGLLRDLGSTDFDRGRIEMNLNTKASSRATRSRSIQYLCEFIVEGCTVCDRLGREVRRSA